MRSIVLLAATMLASRVALAGATIDRSPTVTMGTATAKLVRSGNHLAVSGKATGLIPGDTYTVWWITTDSSGLLVINATGGMANSAGEFSFAAGLPTGTYGVGSRPRFVLVQGSLVDPLNATVVLHVVGHGPPIPGLIPTQISEISAAGCPVGCALATEIIFAP